MPSETFLRLPEEKRMRLVDAAWEEVLRVPFEEVSINKIILRARIPRGSFYQYFADKKDLFFYLLGDMMRYLLGEYSQILRQQEGDMFRAQLYCYDMVVQQQKRDAQFARGVEILQRNPVFLVQQIVENQVVDCIWKAVKAHVDITMFRNEEEELARQTLIMSLVVLVMTMADAAARPEQAEACRQMLQTRLEILKHGSIKPIEEGERE